VTGSCATIGLIGLIVRVGLVWRLILPGRLWQIWLSRLIAFDNPLATANRAAVTNNICRYVHVRLSGVDVVIDGDGAEAAVVTE